MRLQILVLICAISCGCRDATEPVVEQSAPSQPRAAVKLSVLIVDDPELAKGIRLLSGEWNERSGGDLTVAEMTLDEMLAAESLPADLVIYPSRQLGTLAMRNWLRPVRQAVLDDPTLAWGDLLPAFRDQLARYGDEVLALPLGEMPLVMAWRGEPVDPQPTNWEQLDEMPIRIDGEDGESLPLTKQFLARVLAATPPGGWQGLFFEGEDMAANLFQPQMVRAVEQMTKSRSKEAISSTSVTLPRKNSKTRLSPLLPAAEVYNSNLQQWELEEESPAPVICGFAGLLVSVTSTSRNATSAFKLLPWIVSGSTGSQLSQRSPATLWFRPSQVSQAARWLGSAKDDRAKWLTEALSRGDVYLLPRIPGIDQYLAELEAALGNAVAGEQSAADALMGAEERWNAITEKLGRAEQRVAFNRHLGLME